MVGSGVLLIKVESANKSGGAGLVNRFVRGLEVGWSEGAFRWRVLGRKENVGGSGSFSSSPCVGELLKV